MRHGRKSIRGVKLGKVLSVGQQFEHEYDFRTTTELKLKVVAEREGMAVKRKPVQVLAQNEVPEIPCENWGKLATQVCSFNHLSIDPVVLASMIAAVRC